MCLLWGHSVPRGSFRSLSFPVFIGSPDTLSESDISTSHPGEVRDGTGEFTGHRSGTRGVEEGVDHGEDPDKGSRH